MSRLRRAVPTLWQLLLITLLGLPLITPLLRWTQTTCTHDGHLHVHRVAAMRHAWENGIYFTRWLPDLAFGYGYPFFVYREPAPLYAVLLPHLAGLPLPAASNLFYALTILAAGWFMFLWVRDIAGPVAGIVSSVAYMAAPYVLLDALIRGNAPESLALPLLPFLLWTGRRWLVKGSLLAFLASVFGLALLSLSHNISTLIFVPTLLVYLLVLGRQNRQPWPRVLSRLALIFGLGLGLTFWYTGGALLEMDAVTLEQSTNTRNNDFRFNFASWEEILAPVEPEDPLLINPALPIRLGWAPVGLALLGLLTLPWQKRREVRWHMVLMVIAAAVYLFLALAISQPLWERLPLIDFVQFPWRFIGRAALPVAFLAGMPFALLTQRAEADAFSGGWRPYAQYGAVAAALILLLIEAVPGLYPRLCDEELFPTILNVHNYEHATGLVGVDPEGSYFPRTVEQRPKGSPLEADYAAGQPPQRLDARAFPAGAALLSTTYEPLGVSAIVASPEPFTARYLSFAFPGWQVEVDGQPVTVRATDPEGLISFDVPAGRHAISVSWRSTPLRTALSLLGIAALAGTVIAGVWIARRREDRAAAPAVPRAVPQRLFQTLLVLAVAFLLFKVSVVDPLETPLRRSARPQVSQPLQLQAAELRFEGWQASPERAASGGTFDVDLAWRALAPPGAEYQSNIWLAGPDGLLWSDKETYRPRLYEDAPPTWEWHTGDWAWDSREVRVLAGTPPGTYDLVLTLFDLETLEPLTLAESDGTTRGPTAVIGQIEVVAAPEPVPVRPQYPVGEPLPGTGLRLAGYSQDRTEAAPGDTVLLTFFLDQQSTESAEQLTLSLAGTGGEMLHTWTLPAIQETFDAADWPSGQTLRAQHLITLPANLDSDTYQFVLNDTASLGAIDVIAPERLTTMPPVENESDLLLGDSVRLAGYTIGDDYVELVWQALEPLTGSYHVFVHAVDDSGQLLAQADGVPAAWTRPTTGWAEGEYVVDVHELALPPTATELRVGLYNPDNGQRLVGSTADYLPLPLHEK